MPRMLVAYDPAWPSLFEALADGIRSAGDPDWIVEHIGSTAVPGLRAKPVIDLAIRVRDHGDVERHRAALEDAGWVVGSSVTTHPVMVRESVVQRREDAADTGARRRGAPCARAAVGLGVG
ncbi:MAG: GrpB family protein [Microbacterium sp.]